MKKLFIIILILFSSLDVFAEDEPTQVSAIHVGVQANVSLNEAPFFKPGDLRGSIYLGNNRANEEPQFVNMRNEYAFGFGLSADFNRTPNLGLDIELIDANRNYDTPIKLLWGTLDQSTRVETMSILFGLRAFIPRNGPFRAYASAGLGYFRTRMIVYGTLFGYPGYHDEYDTSFEPYYGAGISYDFGYWGLSADYRHYELKGSFSDFKISNANLGANVYLLGWHRRF